MKIFLKTLKLIIDRIKNDDNPENQSRILDSLELAFHEGKGTCNIIHIKKINHP